MSYTTLMAAYEDGQMKVEAEFGNSWLGAMHIWNVLAKKYCGMDTFPLWDEKLRQTVWDLADRAKHPDVSENNRLALLTTLDNYLVAREHIERVALALERFEPTTENLAGQAAAMRVALENGARAIGWHQNSVVENPWVSWDSETEDPIPYSIDTGTKHEWIVPADETRQAP